jgi:hypothetical protein
MPHPLFLSSVSNNPFFSFCFCLFPPLDAVLRYDHQERMTAREAMDHPWLAPVREASLKRHAEEMAAYGLLPADGEPDVSTVGAAAAALVAAGGAGGPQGGAAAGGV